jgi:hypothetical protein
MKKIFFVITLSALVFMSCESREDKIYMAVYNFLKYEHSTPSDVLKELIIVSIDETPTNHLLLLKEDALSDRMQYGRKYGYKEYDDKIAHLDSLSQTAEEKEYDVYFIIAHYTEYVNYFGKDMNFGNHRFIVRKKDYKVIRNYEYEYE